MEAIAPASEIDLAAAAPLTVGVRTRIMIYLGVLIILLGFGSPYGGLIDLPISFFLKNKLHLSAPQVANFRLVSGIPLYLAFVFGLVRDRFNPFGRGDRGYMMLFGGLCSAAYVAFAFSPVSYVTLLIGVIMATVAFQFAFSAQNGLTSQIGQQHVMSGQISTAWNIFLSVPVLSAYALGGIFSDVLEGKHADQAVRILFLVGAALMGAVALYGLLRPKAVFDNLRNERQATSHLGQDVMRMLRFWPVWPALLIQFLWNFAPGSSTPLQFYLQNTLHAPDAIYGWWYAIFSACFIPTFLLFGVLCRTVPLRTLLFWGTVVAIPQMVPLLFVHTVPQALIAAGFIGLMGGLGTAAYLDLLIRSCPPGLQGTTLMMSWALYYVASRFGDVLGTNLYHRFGGFTVCVIAITVVYALILPTLLLIPKRLIATADGAAPEAETPAVFS